MTITRTTFIRTAAALLCSFLILATWAQSHRAKAPVEALAATGDNAARQASVASLFALNSSVDVTPAQGIARVVTGDFNGDGFPDVAVVNPCNQAIAACPDNGSAGWIAVMLGNGTGGFAAPVLYPSGSLSPNSLAVGDLNGDGHLDLVFTSLCVSFDACATSVVSVMLGNGDGTFRTPVPYNSTGTEASAVAIADFNGDGIPDLAVTDLFAADGAGGSVSILLGHGDGTFGNAVGIGSMGAFAVSVAVGDFNGDGIDDLSVVNVGGAYVAGEVVVFLGHGDGTFQPGAAYGTGGYVPGNVVVSDLNQDGVPDVVVVNACATVACTTGGNAGVLLGNGDGTFQAAAGFASGGPNSAFLAVCDYNGDGFPDLAIANPSPGSVTVLQGNGDGTFQSPMSYSPGGKRTVALAMADFNGDGQPDLAVANQVSPDNPSTASSVGILLNTTSGFLLHTDSITVTSSLEPAGPGQSVQLTATVSSSATSGAIGGTLAFYDGTTNLGTVNVTAGVATFATSFATPGVHMIQAIYLGCPSYAPRASAIFKETVGTPVTLTASPNPSAFAQTATLTATVAGSGATGSVIFTDGSNPLGAVPVVGGQATVAASTLAAGAHSLTASYSGNLQPGVGTVSQNILIPNTVQVTSSSEVVLTNSPVTFTATVATQDSVTPTGHLVFLQGTQYLADIPLTNGQATFTTSFSTLGTYQVTAFYLGDALNQSSSATFKQGVAASLPVAAKVTLISSAATTVAFQPLTFTANVTSFYGAIPNGETVTFNDGSNVIGTGVTSGGVATLTTSALAVGTHSITATYSGDSLFKSTTSAAVTETVNGETVVTVLTASPNPAFVSQTVTISVTLTPKYGSVPDGETITFQSGSNSLGTAVTAGGAASLSASFSAAGRQSITATYPGDANFLAHTTTPLTQTVSLSPTTTVVTSSANPAFAAQSVTLSANIAAAFGAVPDGETVTFLDGTSVIGTGATAGGVATLNWSFSTVAVHSVTATYPGDTNLAHSTSLAVRQTVKSGPTSAVLVSGLNPAYVAQPVTLTATITPAYGVVPDGEKITFKNGLKAIGTALTMGGIATLNTSFAAAGSPSLTAAYPGDVTLLASTSPAIPQTVATNTTAVALSSNTSPAFVGQSLTLTAVVTPLFSSVPDGQTITFKNGTKIIGTCLTSGGAASLTTSFAAAGNLSLTASYPGGSTLPPSTSPSLFQSVQKSPTTTTVTSSLNPAYDGQPVTFTASIATQFGSVPDGETVTFYNAARMLGTGTSAAGVAVFTVAFKSPGNQNITAIYAGDAANTSSTSSVLTELTQTDSTTTALASSGSPAWVGQNVTLTATITPLSGSVPDGDTVIFKNGTGTIGTATTVGGVAALTTTFAAAATLSLTASFSGDTVLVASTSPAITQVIKKIPTTTAVATSQTPVFIGQQVTFTATVTTQSGAIPNGETVTFTSGTTALGTATTTAGVASFTTSFAAAGTNYVTATYAGDAAYITSTSLSVKQVVGSTSTTTVLVSSLNPAYVGQPITLTATVGSKGGSVPNGETVTFTAGSNVLGTAATTSGVAAITISSLAAGNYSIVASYPGDGTLQPSTSAAISQAVTKSPTTTALSASSNPSIMGQPVTLTATIAATAGSVPDGESVTFKNGTVVLGTALTSGGIAALSATFSVVGSPQLEAIYSGDAALLGSNSGKVTQVVNANSTTTVVTSSANPSYLSQTVTFSATVTPAYGSVPNGETVTFYNGPASLGTAQTAGGVASFTTSSLAVSPNDAITASYAGDHTYPASTSSALTQVVTTAPTSVALTSSANPAQWQQSIVFTAVMSSIGPLPTGSVTFMSAGTPLGTVNLDNTGTAMFAPAVLDAGTYSITAQYNGSSASAGSTSTVLGQVVTQGTTTTTLASSENPSNFGDTVTFTATVTAGTGAPAGTVTFSANGASLAIVPLSGGVATYSTSALASGQYTITATYNGSTDLGCSNGSLSQSVN